MKNSEEYIKSLEKENAQLKKSERTNKELFKTIFDTHQAILLLIEPHSGNIIDANAAAEKFYQYSRGELLSLKIEDINSLPPEEVEKERLNAFREKRNHFIFPHKLANGDIRWVEVYSSSVKLADEPILFSIIHDITDRRNAEIALRKNEEKFESVFKMNPGSMIISNLKDGTIYDVNEAFYKLIGYKKEEVVGKTTLTIDMYVNPDDRERLTETIKKDGSVRDLEMVLRHRSGEKMNVLISSESLKTSMGQTIITTARDITELKHAELERDHLIEQLAREKKSLSESEQRYRIMGEAIDYGVWATDAEGRAIHISESFCKLVGKTFEEIREFGWIENLVPEQRQKVIDLWMHSVKTGEQFEHEHHFIAKDGSIRILLARGNPIRNTEGEIISWAGINLDITMRKKIQEQLKEQNVRLKKINEVLEDFVQIAAHDLRSPISNLMNISDMIAKQQNVENKMTLLNMIDPLTKRLNRTVNGLMESVSLQTKQKLSGKEIQFTDAWKEVKDDLNTLLQSFKGEIKVSFGEASKINYVEVHLISILRNLVSNSIKYSAESKNPTIEVKTVFHKNFILLTVSDNGIGMNLKDTGNDLFKPFKRFTTKAEGTGIGLYIVKNIVEKNGGFIEVKSEVNEGTTFYCYLKEYSPENVTKYHSTGLAALS